MTNSQRVMVNTGALYARIGITFVLSLLSSRFILGALGVADFGLCSVVAGVMGFMGFVNGAMATSAQRHLTFEFGGGDISGVRRVFNSCLAVHLVWSLFLVVLAETFGLWFLNHVLNIPSERRAAAFWVYQFTVLSSLGSVISVPYQALMTAHEALSLSALLGTIQAIFAFLVAVFISHASGDRLIIYTLLGALIAVGMTLCQMVLCRRLYVAEARIDRRGMSDWRQMRELLAFSGWSLFGAAAVVTRFQGLGFLLNIFFGVGINAAYGIANQVSAQVSQLTQAAMQAISPRIIKHEGAGNRERVVELSLIACKYTSFLACLLVVPLFTELPTILPLWLKSPPEHTLVFCRIVLLVFLVDQMSSGLSTVALAIGRIALYQTLVGSIHILTLPLAYLLLRLGFSPSAVLWASFSTVVVTMFVRAAIVANMAGFPYFRWLKRVAFPVVLGVTPAAAVSLTIAFFWPASVLRLLVGVPVTCIIAVLGMYFLGAVGSEQEKMRDEIHGLLSKIFSRSRPLRLSKVP